MSRRRWALALLLVLALELLLWRGYASFRTTWHFLLHTGLGVGAGLSAAALLSAARRRPTRGLAWGLGGQLLSVAPDVMFRMLRMPHERWMDVFIAHITIHTSPLPLLATTSAGVLGTWAWFAAASARPRTATGLAGAALLLLGVVLTLHTPVPTTLADYYRDYYR